MGFLFAVGTTRRDFIPTDAQQLHSRRGPSGWLVPIDTSPRILCHELTFLPIRATQVAPGGAGWHDGSDGCGCSALRVAAAIARRRRSQSLCPHILFTFIVIASEVYNPKGCKVSFPHH